MCARSQPRRFCGGPAQQHAWPGWLQYRQVLAPEAVFLRPFDRMVLACHVVDRKTAGEGLNVGGLCLLRSVGLAGLRTRFKSGDVLGTGERKEVALFRSVQEVSGIKGSFMPALQILYCH